MKLCSLGIAAGLVLAACAPIEGASPPATGDDAAEQCRADQYRSWIGRNRSQLPTPPAGETWRVTCTTCPVTMDYNPRRLNIFYNDATGVIEQVRCG